MPAGMLPFQVILQSRHKLPQGDDFCHGGQHHLLELVPVKTLRISLSCCYLLVHAKHWIYITARMYRAVN